MIMVTKSEKISTRNYIIPHGYFFLHVLSRFAHNNCNSDALRKIIAKLVNDRLNKIYLNVIRIILKVLIKKAFTKICTEQPNERGYNEIQDLPSTTGVTEKQRLQRNFV